MKTMKLIATALCLVSITILAHAELGTQTTNTYYTIYELVEVDGAVAWEATGAIAITTVSDSTDEFDYATYVYNKLYFNPNGPSTVVHDFGFTLKFTEDGYEVVAEW